MIPKLGTVLMNPIAAVSLQAFVKDLESIGVEVQYTKFVSDVWVIADTRSLIMAIPKRSKLL